MALATGKEDSPHKQAWVDQFISDTGEEVGVPLDKPFRTRNPEGQDTRSSEIQEEDGKDLTAARKADADQMATVDLVARPAGNEFKVELYPHITARMTREEQTTWVLISIRPNSELQQTLIRA